jgi:two-component system, LytTR family, sensor kinase
MLPFIIVFIINSIWLLPMFLFKGNTSLYIVFLLMVVTIVSATFQVAGPVLYKNDPKMLQEKVLQDPQWGREEMRPGAPPLSPGNAIGSPELFKSPSEERIPQKRRIPAPGQSVFLFINTFFISLLIAGFNTAIAVTNRWFTEEQARKEIEKEHMQSELAFLQNQVSPHFFMNTLNNIHSLIEADQKLAQNAVLKLSEMMRYLLYESGRGSTTLSREIEFLRSYIKLMQLRVDESVNVHFELPDKFNNLNLPPLLFISFIENAFKHGVSYREPSALSFTLIQNPDSIEFIAVNTISSYRNDDSIVHHGGLGLENIKKRLDLLYGDNYKLIIDITDNKFKVKLIIPT